MNDDSLLEITNKMEETLGKENFAMISDQIGELITGNSTNLKESKKLKPTLKSFKIKMIN